MEKHDYRKELSGLYRLKTGAVAEIDVPEMRFLMIDGRGDPNTSESFPRAVEALFSVSYTLKFMVKKGEPGVDYAVMPLEGLWWADDITAFTAGDKSDWKWTLMMMQPPLVTPVMVEEACVRVREKKNPAALPLLRFESFREGLCAQALHTGPFSEEGPLITAIHDHITRSGRRLRGKHHEIYLSDTRRTAPEKWKTIIRQPME